MSNRMEKARQQRSDAELAIDKDAAVKVVLAIATYLGANGRWDSGMLEGVAATINRKVLAPAGIPACDTSQDAKYWRRQADLLGMDYNEDD